MGQLKLSIIFFNMQPRLLLPFSFIPIQKYNNMKREGLNCNILKLKGKFAFMNSANAILRFRLEKTPKNAFWDAICSTVGLQMLLHFVLCSSVGDALSPQITIHSPKERIWAPPHYINEFSYVKFYSFE